jgi:hypothetical protein
VGDGVAAGAFMRVSGGQRGGAWLAWVVSWMKNSAR